MRRIISLILVLMLSMSALLTSCGKEVIEYDEGEVLTAARELIEKSTEFNDIFWGKGLEYIEGSSYDSGNYSPAEYHKYYVTIDDILSSAAKIFSVGYMDNVKMTVFSAQFGDTGLGAYSRYYQESKGEPIMVRTDYNPVLVDENSFLYDTLTFVGADEDSVTVKISLKVTRGEMSQVIERKINLVYEDGWQIDSHTFANYNVNI